jgi:hypothetical protein
MGKKSEGCEDKLWAANKRTNLDAENSIACLDAWNFQHTDQEQVCWRLKGSCFSNTIVFNPSRFRLVMRLLVEIRRTGRLITHASL